MSKGKLAKSSDHPVAAQIRRELGVGPDEDVSVTTPQFEREPGSPYRSSGEKHCDLAWWDKLASLSSEGKTVLGMRRWGRKKILGKEVGPMLWLFPGEWYTSIPQGLRIVDINFENEKFVPGVTDNDIRFGCLAFGVFEKTS